MRYSLLIAFYPPSSPSSSSIHNLCFCFVFRWRDGAQSTILTLHINSARSNQADQTTPILPLHRAGQSGRQHALDGDARGAAAAPGGRGDGSKATRRERGSGPGRREGRRVQASEARRPAAAAGGRIHGKRFPHPPSRDFQSICAKHSERIGVRRCSRPTRRKKRSARRARQRNRLGSGITRGTCPSAGGSWTRRIGEGSFRTPKACRTGLDRAKVEAFCDRRKPTLPHPQCRRLDLFMLFRRRLFCCSVFNLILFFL